MKGGGEGRWPQAVAGTAFREMVNNVAPASWGGVGEREREECLGGIFPGYSLLDLFIMKGTGGHEGPKMRCTKWVGGDCAPSGKHLRDPKWGQKPLIGGFFLSFAKISTKEIPLLPHNADGHIRCTRETQVRVDGAFQSAYKKIQRRIILHQMQRNYTPLCVNQPRRPRRVIFLSIFLT